MAGDSIGGQRTPGQGSEYLRAQWGNVTSLFHDRYSIQRWYDAGTFDFRWSGRKNWILWMNLALGKFA